MTSFGTYESTLFDATSQEGLTNT